MNSAFLLRRNRSITNDCCVCSLVEVQVCDECVGRNLGLSVETCGLELWRVPIAGELTRSRGDPCRAGQCRGHRAVVDSCIALFWLEGLIAGAGLFEEHGTRTSDLHRPGCDAQHYKNVGACVEVLFLLCTCCLTVHLRAMVVPHCRSIVAPRLVVAWVVKYSGRRLTARVLSQQKTWLHLLHA